MNTHVCTCAWDVREKLNEKRRVMKGAMKETVRLARFENLIDFLVTS